MATSSIDIDDPDYVRPEQIQSFVDKFNRAVASGTMMARHTKASLDWFRKQVSKNTKLSRRKMIQNSEDYRVRKGNENRTLIGRLYYFEYEAKEAGDRELGVYDRFPMVFVFNATISEGGHKLLHAINMHYLMPKERAIVYLKLMKLKNKKGWTNATKLKATWKLLKSVADHDMLKRAVHSYRIDRIQHHKMVEIHPGDWEIALFLQLAQWHHIDSHEAADQKNIRTKRRQAQRK